MTTLGMIVLGHGSRRSEVGTAFEALVARVGASIADYPVLPAFFSLGTPTLADQVRQLVDKGCTRIVILQYFLYNGIHIEKDIPAMIAALRQEFPAVCFELQPTLQDDPALERLLVDRLVSACPS
ncbi:MAG: hypothetical protein GX055_05515 [Desulfovibrionales bacterium]|nr:hypothetical protein [Desulfovibrionales bacterium]